eukprot:TRINITY_DN22218_c0_g1_i1.p1 TRINITY_DN22218_c0_g1~~TRINITY_DN22218_c0_g1_i1.p1  ORF type:complete len:1958 (-),score=615.01 TRINITY_DN22218_c0_g1_i1:364-6237(-)
MSLGSGFLENIPHFTFTPTEHQVECVKVAGGRNLTFVLTQPNEKSFLVLMLVREVAQCVRGGGGKAALLVYESAQVGLWASFLTRMTDLKVAGLDECSELDTGQIVESAGVLVTTHATFTKVLNRKHLSLDQCRLVIVDNIQASFDTTEANTFLSLYNSIPKNQAPRLITLTPNILSSNLDSSLTSLPHQLDKLQSLIPASVECSCEIATQLRYLARPRESILEFSIQELDTQCELELRIRDMLDELKVWIIDQNYSLYDTYGEEFGDLIADIPDPALAPLQILQDFTDILGELGVWCADRAALILMIKIDKLKTREKYERHFLLLSVLFTLMVRIRKLCDDTYGDIEELAKLEKYSRPKLERLVQLLQAYSPGVTEPKAEEGEGVVAPVRRRGGGRRLGNIPEDPDTLCSLVVVSTAFSAKILYHYLKDLSRSRPELSFLCPQYAVQDPLPSDPKDAENERKKQEEALRRFRMRECNILVSSSVLEEGIDFVKCNLVILFDPPGSFHRYVYTKVKCKSVGGSLIHLSSESDNLLSELERFRCLERTVVTHCTNQAADSQEDLDADQLVSLAPGYPLAVSSPPLTLSTSVLVLNRYCAKLPSDTFTRLTPSWTVEPSPDGGYYCALFLPINSPLKGLVVGQVMPSAALARRSAAYSACVQLHQIRELDSMMLPVGKESVLPQIKVEWLPEDAVRPGTTKRRQYYYKRVAKCLTTETDDTNDTLAISEAVTAIDLSDETAKEESHKAALNQNSKFYEPDEDPALKEKYAALALPTVLTYSLYSMQMVLTCPIPEEQNTRGRKIHDPAHSSQLFGLLLPHGMPAVPAFPIYTRSGEVLVKVTLVQDRLTFTKEQLNTLYAFHMFTFSSVLRLEKYPMVFSASSSHNSIVVVPMRSGSPPKIDWLFLSLISSLATRKLRSLPDEERADFSFDAPDYTDAVIMPWYRNQDQPQYFYVAEICQHLNPASDFPGEGFETFSKYYSTKYGINIQNSNQPLLDVDHTSARLNFLTPRYVNRKGIALPTSSEETKRNKRENLDQKQILVPELCAVHPFPASLWRQAVSLPCTLYRLNGLLIADEIRRVVATEMRLGVPNLGLNFDWPALNFGWTLADVVSAKVEDKADTKAKSVTRDKGENKKEEMGEFGEWDENWTAEEDMDIVAEKLITKLAEEERANRKKKLEIGTWSNEMAGSDSVPVPGLEGAEGGGLDWGKEGSDEEDELDMEGIELPDNLTFISTKGVDIGVEGKKDWGTGIQAKNFRVGSPTCFTGNNMAGLLDDLDGFSCSDSEDSWGEDDMSDTEVEQSGGARIEFHGENTAEAIEGEGESKAREERVARDRDQEASMVKNMDWDPMSLVGVIEGNSVEPVEVNVTVISEEDTVLVIKPSDLIKSSKPDLSQCTPTDSTPAPPQVDHDTVLRHMALSPDLDLVKPPQQEEWGVIPWPGIDPDNQFSFDQQPELSSHPGPSPSLILQALTMSNSNDAINLERLETIGDSFLKYAITTFLFCQHPNIHEGKLSHLRSKQVSNLNLYQLGQARGLGECMIATKFEPHDNWLPPCYHVPRELEQALIESGVPASHWNMADLPRVEDMTQEEICTLLREKCGALCMDTTDQDIQSIPSFIPYNLLTQHSIPDKSIADCVEALIGAYLIACGPRGALLFMTWLGIAVLPPAPENTQPASLSPPPSPLLVTPSISQPERHLQYLLDGFNKFEHMIGYVWRDKCYLLQAFSHASFYPNRLTDCYQRLEFLGDAVLDYLITRHLYQDPRLHSPGALTDLRSALVNNTIFACLAVRHQFHKFFKHLSPGLQTVCDRFVRIQAENGWKVSEECYLIEEDETEEAEDIEVPKALGDIFESVAGSIYLDSGLSLDAVWKVYYRMMRDEIDQFSSHVPKSPIRELLELEPETAKFGKPEKLADGRRVRVSVEVFGKGVFKGIGRNYRIAKCTAAKCALKALKKMDHKKRK